MPNSTVKSLSCSVLGTFDVFVFKQYVQFICGGLGATVAAIAVATVLFNKELRRNYRMFFNVALGHCLNSLAWFLSAAQRQVQVANGTHTTCVRTVDCMATSYFGLYCIGTQLPMIANLCMAVERLFAIGFPIFYKVNWTLRFSNGLAAGVLIFATVSCIAAYPAVYLTQPWKSLQAICLPADAMGQYYGSYNYGIGCVCCSLSFVLSIFTVILMRWRLKRAREREAAEHHHRGSSRGQQLASQQYKAVSLAILSSVSFVFTIGSISIQTGWISQRLPIQASQVVLGLYCLDAFVAVGSYVVVNTEFRHGLARMFCVACRRKNAVTNVVTSQRHTNTIPSAREHGMWHTPHA